VLVLVETFCNTTDVSLQNATRGLSDRFQRLIWIQIALIRQHVASQALIGQPQKYDLCVFSYRHRLRPELLYSTMKNRLDHQHGQQHLEVTTADGLKGSDVCKHNEVVA
jgi:hypothetical protein